MSALDDRATFLGVASGLFLGISIVAQGRSRLAMASVTSAMKKRASSKFNDALIGL
jgi:hypothetical protein